VPEMPGNIWWKIFLLPPNKFNVSYWYHPLFFLYILLFKLQRFQRGTTFSLQGSASESTLVGLLAAKQRTVRRIQALHPEWDEGTIKGKLVAYSSGSPHDRKYSRGNSTKSPGSGAGNA
jgi:hypothetical protein